MSILPIPDILLGISAVVSAATPVMLAILNANQQRSAKRAEIEARKVATELAGHTEIIQKDLRGIHVGVNSERTALREQIDRLEARIADLTQQLVEKTQESDHK